MSKKPFVLIQYYGETPLQARCAQGEEKIEFENGDVQFAEEQRARHLCGAYKFELVNPADITPEMLEQAQVRVNEIREAEEKLAAEMAELNEEQAKKAKKEAKMTAELKDMKNRYNKGEFTNDEYQAEKKKIQAKWDKIFAGKGTKKEKEEAPEGKEETPEGEKETPEEEFRRLKRDKAWLDPKTKKRYSELKKELANK